MPLQNKVRNVRPKKSERIPVKKKAPIKPKKVTKRKKIVNFKIPMVAWTAINSLCSSFEAQYRNKSKKKMQDLKDFRDWWDSQEFELKVDTLKLKRKVEKNE